MAFKDIFVQNQWNSSPIAYWTIQYEHKRSDADMLYRFYWKIWLKNSTGWFYNGLKLKLFLNGSENAITVKGYNANQKGWSYEGTTDWYTVSNKTSGTTPFYAQLYDTNDNATEKTSTTYSLDISPSAATATKVPASFTDLENPTLEFSNPAGFNVIPYINFYDSNGNKVHSIVRAKGSYASPYTFTLTDTERTAMRNACNAKNEYETWIGVQTFSGDTSLGYGSLKSTFKIVDANPTFDASLISFKDTNTKTTGITGSNQTIVQNKSTLSVTCGAATAYKGATISKYEVTLNGVTETITTANGGTVSMGAVAKDGNLKISVKVIDSRGNSVTKEKDITIIPYSKPVLAKHSSYGQIVCERCDANGVIDKSGKYLKLIIKGKWHSLKNGENSATVDVQITSKGYESSWINVPATVLGGGSANNYQSWVDINTKVNGVTFELTKAYVVTIRCIDEFGTVSDETTYTDLSYKIPTDDVCLHLGKKGNKAAFGTYADEDKVLKLMEEWLIKYKGDYIQDFIVDAGTYHGWSYEKYQSGVMKQWTIITPTFTSWSTWGNNYWYTSSVNSYNFAHAFASGSQPCINATNWSTSWAIPFIQNATNTGFDIYGARPTAGVTSANAYYFSIMAIGRWK